MRAMDMTARMAAHFDDAITTLDASRETLAAPVAAAQGPVGDTEEEIMRKRASLGNEASVGDVDDSGGFGLGVAPDLEMLEPYAVRH